MTDSVVIDCLRGRSSGRDVLLGFAPASLLHRLSFADVLDEGTGRGYQRPFNEGHSLDFRRYIHGEFSATIPLTLNLRPDASEDWKIVSGDRTAARLEILSPRRAIMSQVDCQHRLGFLGDTDVSLPFMCFIGLSEREEMEIFNIINSKAKGLSASLLDYHQARLAADLSADRPELYIALQMNRDESSPWCGRLNLGGKSTSGLKRMASLRTMSQAIYDFLRSTRALPDFGTDAALVAITDFWKAIVLVLPDQWGDPRRHMLTKGVGVYALTRVAADICIEARSRGATCEKRLFVEALSDFATGIDWSTTGALKGFGGQNGVKEAVDLIRGHRHGYRSRLKVVNG